MELGEWIWGRIIEKSDNRGLDNRGSTVIAKNSKHQVYTTQPSCTLKLLRIGQCNCYRPLTSVMEQLTLNSARLNWVSSKAKVEVNACYVLQRHCKCNILQLLTQKLWFLIKVATTVV